MSRTQRSETASAWRSAVDEWRRRCTLERCSAESAALLRGYARSLFDSFCRRYAAWASIAGGEHPFTPPAHDCWHLLETRLAVHRTRAGQRYKDWLFERTCAAGVSEEERLRGGLALLMRDVVRHWLAHECPRADTVTFETGPHSDPKTETALIDRLPADESPFDEVCDRDVEQKSSQIADRVFRRLDERRRLLLATRALDAPLYGPIQQLIRCPRSTAYRLLRALLVELSDEVRREYPVEPPSVQWALARGAWRGLLDRALSEIRREKIAARLFSLLETAVGPEKGLTHEGDTRRRPK